MPGSAPRFVFAAGVVVAMAGVLAQLAVKPTRLDVAPQPKSTATISFAAPPPTAAPTPTAPPRPVSQSAYRAVSIEHVPAAYARPRARTALVIGINDDDPTNPLHGARTDAGNMRNALFKYGFRSSDVVVLLDGQATRARILAELQRLVARTPADGIAVFAAASHGAGSSFRTADGARLYASELGRYLGSIRAPVWTALAMCYAAGFAVPGVVGDNRIATFSSAADEKTFEAGEAGSDMFSAMLREAMIEGRAPRSVESAFLYARSSLARWTNNLPVMSDGVSGDLVLGETPAAVRATATPGPPPRTPEPVVNATPEPTPTPAPNNGGVGGILCGLLGCKRS